MRFANIWPLVAIIILSSCESVKFKIPVVPKCNIVKLDREILFCIDENGKESFKEIKDCIGCVVITTEDLEIEEDFFMDKVRRLENCLTAKKYKRWESCN